MDTDHPTALRLLVRPQALAEVRIEPLQLASPPEPGSVLLRIERFAFTANNITYAKFGEAMHYWRFFPAGDGWGGIPVRGFAMVKASAVDGVTAGERFYGFWPMATHAVLRPAAIGRRGLMDSSVQRAALPAIYNRYHGVASLDGCDASREGEYAVLRPLFATAWLIDDFFSENHDFGARQVLLSCASSKAAYATASASRDDRRERGSSA